MADYSVPWGGPSQLYQPNSNIAQLILQAGQQRALGQERMAAIIASGIGQLGQIPRDISEAKLLDARTAREQQLAESEKQQMEDARITAAKQTKDQDLLDRSLGGGDPSFNGPPTEQQVAAQGGSTDRPASGLSLTPEMVAQHLMQAGAGHLIPQALDNLSKSAKAREEFQKQQHEHVAGELMRTVVPYLGTPLAMSGLAGAAQNLADFGMDKEQIGRVMDAVQQNPDSLPKVVEGLMAGTSYAEAFDKQIHPKLTQIAPGGSLADESGKIVATVPKDNAITPYQQQELALKRRELDLKANELSGGAPTAPTGGATALTGDEFLKSLPDPAYAQQVKAYAEGRMPIPAGFALKSPYFQKMMRDVSQYDPSFDAVNYPGRVKARQDFTAGASAKQITALNTVVGHLSGLADKADALDNTSFPALNKLENMISVGTGSAKVTDFNTIKKGVTDELTKIWRQSGGSEQDIKSWAEGLNAAGSPEQLRGQMATIGSMLESRLAALENQKQQGMGKGGEDIKVITPESQKLLDRLQGMAPQEPKGPPKVTSKAEMDALPSGTEFIAPDGSRRRKP